MSDSSLHILLIGEDLGLRETLGQICAQIQGRKLTLGWVDTIDSNSALRRQEYDIYLVAPTACKDEARAILCVKQELAVFGSRPDAPEAFPPAVSLGSWLQKATRPRHKRPIALKPLEVARPLSPW